MAAQAKVIIKAEENISSAVNSAKNSLTKLEGACSQVGSTIKSALTFTAIVAAVKKLGDAVSACFNDFSEANRKYKQLEIALGSGEAYEKVSDTIAVLSRQTLESKDSIESMVSELAALGKSADEIEKISKASVYLSNVTGRDLNSSMTTLLNTYTGTTTQLKRLGIDVSDLTSAELENGEAIDRVISSLGKYSEELAEIDTRQHLTNIANAWGDIQQSVGDLINYSFSPMISSLDTAINNIQVRFDAFVQNTKIVLSNFPEFINKLGETASSIIGKIFSYEGIKSHLETLVKVVPKYFKLAIDDAIAVLDLSLNAIPDAVNALMEGIYNYGMYLLVSFCDDVGVDISELINNIGTWLTESDIGKVINNILSTVINGVKLMGALIKNIPDMLELVVDNADTIVKNSFIALKNFFFGGLSDIVTATGQTLERINFPQLVENIKTAFTNVFGKVGAWFTAIGSTAKDTFRYIGDILKVTFEWDSLKTIFTTLFKNIGAMAAAVIKTIFVSIPKMIGNLFSGIIEWIGYVGVKLKNTILEAIQNVIRDAGEKIQGTWFGKLFGFGGKLAAIDLGVDTEGEEKLLKRAEASFSSIGDNFSEAVQNAVDTASVIEENNKAVKDLYQGVKGITVATPDYTEVTAAVKDSGEIVEKLFTWGDTLLKNKEDNSEAWAEIGEKFDTLLSPVIEEWEASTGETIGEKLATWTAKSGDEYLKASKKSFSSIGDSLKTWGAEFVSSNKDALSEIWKDIKTYAGDMFGDDIDEFTSWLGAFLERNSVKTTTAIEEGTGSVVDAIKGKSTSSSILSSAWDKATDSGLKDESDSSLSIFGKESGISNIVSSLSSSLGTLLDSVMAIIDAVVSGCWWMEFLVKIVEGFVSVMSPMIDAVLAPLNDALTLTGEMLAELFLPIFNRIYPIMQIVADILMTAVVPVLQMLSPIIEIVALVFDALTPVISALGKVFTLVMAPIQYVADLLSWLGRWIGYFGECIGTALYNITHPFSAKSMPSSPGGFSSDAFSGLYDRLVKWDEYGTHTSAVTDAVSTQTAVSSASYQGATQVTINIYQEAPVVGDGGMRRFAQMVRDEFEALDYYGVTI